MKSRIIIAICLTIVGMCACKEPAETVPKSKHLLRNFQNPVAMYATASLASSSIQGISEVRYNNLSVWVESFKNTEELAEYIVSAEQKEQLYEQFGDMNFNDWNVISAPVLYRQSIGLDIISDTDYDATHPAGTSLNDIFTCLYQCADNMLNPPYNNKKTAEQELSTPNLPCYYFKENMTVFNEKKPTLIVFNFHLTPTVPPATTSTHRFTVTYKNIDGVELSSTTEPVTIKP